MNKLIIGAIILIAVSTGVFLLKPNTATAPADLAEIETAGTEQESQKTNITATFTIITDKITRSFANPKYHNQSANVFITAEEPSLVRVMKTGIKWSHFFATLPMKLTKACLITGDGETLCKGKQGTLKFYLNDAEDKDLLDREIKQGDRALIKFTSY
ncbi:MAG: hypothetical protein HYU48_02625 [Candidatus Levybacteria bacterium]|nr:hypothetical protein [Candidatus Levybacteria bacterium]